jgi:CubicO group peptidase (beta-lactamase class C family)
MISIFKISLIIQKNMKKILLLGFIIIGLTALGQGPNQAVLDSIIRLSERTNSNALLIYKDNQLVYSNYFDNDVQPIEAMSASKSIVSLAVGLLVDKGFIKSIDEPVYTLYPEWKQGNKKFITIRHLLNHTSGLQNVPNAGIEIEVSPDVIQLALCAELESYPGEKFSYNNKASNLLAGIVEKASGLAMDKFLDKFLFSPMGIRNFSWVTDKAGNPLGMSGFQVLPEDLARIGHMVMNKGQWEGKQLVSEDWITQMVAPAEAGSNYGFEWWLMYEGQALVIDDDFLLPLKPSVDSTAYLLLQKLSGRYEGGMNELRGKAMGIYNREELGSVAKVLASIPEGKMKLVNSGKVIGYVARGYLGQNLIIIPGKQLVVVRMITAENFRKVPNNSQFGQLEHLVKELY